MWLAHDLSYNERKCHQTLDFDNRYFEETKFYLGKSSSSPYPVCELTRQPGSQQEGVFLKPLENSRKQMVDAVWRLQSASQCRGSSRVAPGTGTRTRGAPSAAIVALLLACAIFLELDDSLFTLV
eukprot:GHVU01134525.1.p3 GENE.GHVU01134525.1~~GHVU01134525.1.p3  ORF type:complete len:125 (-),score=18.59 GHVU01134525.1:230-604(-)